MTEMDPRMQRVVEAREAGRDAEALALVQEIFADLEHKAGTPGPSLFFTLFMWRQLVEDDAAARAALAALRDAQVRKLQAGDEYFGKDQEGIPAYTHLRERFAIIVEMNDMLAEPAATRALFVELERTRPALAPRRAGWVLPALVAVGDFERAHRYLRDPLDLLDVLNVNARTLPLFPPPGQAPRLAAELMGLTANVRLGAAILDGLGRADEARSLHAALIDGLESPELRDWAAREYAAPGAISGEISARHLPPAAP